MNELTEYSKSDISLLIVNILKNHTNEHKRITQIKIRELLKKDYNFDTGIRTLSSTMRRLIAIDENIHYDEIERANGEIEYKNWGYKQLLSDGELRLLIDQIRYDKNLLVDDREDFCKRLKKLSLTKELDKVKLDKYREESDFEINQMYIQNIEAINRAINSNKQIKFNLQIYDINKNYYVLDKIYTVVPEELVIRDGAYYLIARFDTPKKYQFRVDKIAEVEILTSNELKLSNTYYSKEIDKYLEERVYLVSGELEKISLVIKDNYIIDKLVTDFDKAVTFTRAKDNKIYAKLKTNRNAFDIWILKYKDMVEEIK